MGRVRQGTVRRERPCSRHPPPSPARRRGVRRDGDGPLPATMGGLPQGRRQQLHVPPRGLRPAAPDPERRGHHVRSASSTSPAGTRATVGRQSRACRSRITTGSTSPGRRSSWRARRARAARLPGHPRTSATSSTRWRTGPTPVDVAWIGQSLHHLLAPGKLALMRRDSAHRRRARPLADLGADAAGGRGPDGWVRRLDLSGRSAVDRAHARRNGTRSGPLPRRRLCRDGGGVARAGPRRPGSARRGSLRGADGPGPRCTVSGRRRARDRVPLQRSWVVEPEPPMGTFRRQHRTEPR